MESHEEPPSKRRCDKERVRVTRACDSCKKKKLRCTGTLPCNTCQRTGKTCEYTADYNRGKLPLVRIAHQPVQESNGQQQQSSSAVEPDRLPLLPQSRLAQSCNMTDINNSADNPPSRASLEPHQTDLEGHYVGPSSGVSFLIRAQKRLYKYLSLPINTPIFTFGDSPLPEVDSGFMLLPPRNEANALVARYFDFAFPTHRFLHQQQVEGWVDEFYSSMLGSEAPSFGMRGKRAVILMVFAQARQCPPESDQNSTSFSNNSAAYFAASEKQLNAETGPVRLTSVQARLAQCFYLLSQSRINHCWSLFGTTARLAMAIGLHRTRKREMGASVDHIDFECRKRVFWCAYSLDNYLSAALGRPRIFHDDDIDQDFPTVADDSRILREQILPPTSNAQSVMLAPLYHAKLSVIIGSILHDVYGPHRASSQSEASAAAQHGADLNSWREEISSFLDSSNVDLLILIYQRQYTVLNLAFYHAQILLYRPFIIKSFGAFVDREKPRKNFQTESVNQYINVCLTAATKIAAMIRELVENCRMYSTFWVRKYTYAVLESDADTSTQFTHYYGFSAIMVLYVRVIQLAAQKRSLEEVSKYLQIGEQAQRDLASCGSRSSFARRYVVVLEELRLEARAAANQNDNSRVLNTIRDNTPTFSHTISEIGSLTRHDGVQLEEFESVNGPLHANKEIGVDCRIEETGGLQGTNLMIPPSMQSNSSQWLEGGLEVTFPMTGLPELADWEHLDSLAVAGMGELDFLFSHDVERRN
ncbi:hypothetical protein UA08_02213 [Talaromyces atroroseus]|uniref:Zn(2)-C6 fungal-type domain-containing protein n=1 Tax=Talaromyces atroroseus TaxID=1441469 RepID=A0A225B3C2_TALAT|nr:hypothetical protein UA08_02213 [Talaromyces atroroseus]OKL61786.1 hypothetical protein UA08_02213 [Talaromyces atroroseus]